MGIEQIAEPKISDLERGLLEDCALVDLKSARSARAGGLGSASFALGQSESVLSEPPVNVLILKNRFNVEDLEDCNDEASCCEESFGAEISVKRLSIRPPLLNGPRLEAAKSTNDVCRARQKFLLGLVNTTEISSDYISNNARTKYPCSTGNIKQVL